MTWHRTWQGRYFNNLNLKFQEGKTLFTILCKDVASLKIKLELLVNQLSETQLANLQHQKESGSKITMIRVNLLNV